MTQTTLTCADVQERLLNARAEILRFGVRRLALFGSVQRGTARPESDVDLLVEFEAGQKSYDHFFALGELLEHLLELGHRIIYWRVSVGSRSRSGNYAKLA